MERALEEVLLAQLGLIFFDSESGELAPEADVVGFELALAQLGYLPTQRLRVRLRECSSTQLGEYREWVIDTLQEVVGAKVDHTPLFRHFPAGVPVDSAELWWKKVLVHFLQAPNRPCLFCGRVGTTHVLNPCAHVVCDHCFDGSNYSACPSCEHRVDRSSPFFSEVPAAYREPTPTALRHFKLLDAAAGAPQRAKALIAGFCRRTKSLSLADCEVLERLVAAMGLAALDDLPQEIIVRENIALIFGTLAKRSPACDVLARARPYLKTPTDLLRFIAVLSGQDPSLQPKTVRIELDSVQRASPGLLRQVVSRFFGSGPRRVLDEVKILVKERSIRRFPVAKLSRPLRRQMLQLLDGFDEVRLVEGLLLHRSYWIWLGEFLHPREYAKRFSNAARAFEILRDGQVAAQGAGRFQTWAGRREAALHKGEIREAVAILSERPGELGRRVDLCLRLAARDPEQIAAVVPVILDALPKMATPVLLTLLVHLPGRSQPASGRVYWPKGRQARGILAEDLRQLIPVEVTDEMTRALTDELLVRFAKHSHFDRAVVDHALSSVLVPFSERSASESLLALPRGSNFKLESSAVLRLFLHWCEPQGSETEMETETQTDLDLSVGFYGHDWRELGVCSYYQLSATTADGETMAKSSGDLRNAPWPDGSSEFVDVELAKARKAGVRYLVMVVNSYAGLPFDRLERAFAGLMLSELPLVQHFDARNVELKFELRGDNGVYLPLVVDVEQGRLHWLDIYSKGQFAWNNLGNSKNAITRLCPALLTYFASGVRPNMFGLALLHAAARSNEVSIRQHRMVTHFRRRDDESVAEFHHRMLQNEADRIDTQLSLAGDAPVFAALLHGDLELPDTSSAYALFRNQVVGSIAASDLLSDVGQDLAAENASLTR